MHSDLAPSGNEAALRSYAGPILLAHRVNDEIAPVSQGRRLAAVAGERGHLVIVSPADHDAPWDWNAFGAALMQFYREIGVVGGDA
jgi:hypothetical protein